MVAISLLQASAKCYLLELFLQQEVDNILNRCRYCKLTVITDQWMIRLLLNCDCERCVLNHALVVG